MQVKEGQLQEQRACDLVDTGSSWPWVVGRTVLPLYPGEGGAYGLRRRWIERFGLGRCGKSQEAFAK